MKYAKWSIEHSLIKTNNGRGKKHCTFFAKEPVNIKTEYLCGGDRFCNPCPSQQYCIDLERLRRDQIIQKSRGSNKTYKNNSKRLQKTSNK